MTTTPMPWVASPATRDCSRRRAIFIRCSCAWINVSTAKIITCHSRWLKNFSLGTKTVEPCHFCPRLGHPDARSVGQRQFVFASFGGSSGFYRLLDLVGSGEKLPRRAAHQSGPSNSQEREDQRISTPDSRSHYESTFPMNDLGAGQPHSFDCGLRRRHGVSRRLAASRAAIESPAPIKMSIRR